MSQSSSAPSWRSKRQTLSGILSAVHRAKQSDKKLPPGRCPKVALVDEPHLSPCVLRGSAAELTYPVLTRSREGRVEQLISLETFPVAQRN